MFFSYISIEQKHYFNIFLEFYSDLFIVILNVSFNIAFILLALDIMLLCTTFQSIDGVILSFQV